GRCILQPLIIEVERLVIVVDFRQMRVVEDLGEQAPLAALARRDFAVVTPYPTAFPTILVFPVLGITHARLGFDIIEPHVLRTFARSPHVLAGHRTSMTTNALVQIENLPDLRAYFHRVYSCAWMLSSSPSSQSTFFILRMTSNSSRLESTVP